MTQCSSLHVSCIDIESNFVVLPTSISHITAANSDINDGSCQHNITIKRNFCPYETSISVVVCATCSVFLSLVSVVSVCSTH